LQRDLSASYNNIGDVLVAQGNLADALKSFRDSLAIRERLAQADQANVQSQIDLILSHWRLALQGDDAVRHWSLIVVTLRKLDTENKLTAEQQRWLLEAEKKRAQVQLE